MDHLAEAAAIFAETGIPDAPLIAKAFEEANKAMAADNQARELAKNALSGLDSASQQESNGPAGPIDIVQIQDIATQPNPNAAQVQGELAAQGVGFTETASASPASAPTVADSKAADDGRSPAGVLAGTQSSVMQTRVESWTVSKTGSPNGIPLDPTKEAASSPGAAGSGVLTAAQQAAAKRAAVVTGKRKLARNRAQVRKQLGLSAEAQSDAPQVPLLAKEEDIFKVVHDRYAGLNMDGIFFGLHLPMLPGESPETELATNRMIMKENRNFVLQEMHPTPQEPKSPPLTLGVVNRFPE